MNKRRMIRQAVFTLCALAAVAAARAESPEGAPQDREKWEQKREGKIKEMHKKLGLTPDQEKALDEHRKSHREEAKKLHESLRQKREALKQELEKPDMDEARVKAIHGEIKGLDDQMADQRLNGILEVRKILTPEQFKKFHEMMHAEWGERGGDFHKGKGRGRGHHDRDEENPAGK